MVTKPEGVQDHSYLPLIPSACRAHTNWSLCIDSIQVHHCFLFLYKSEPTSSPRGHFRYPYMAEWHHMKILMQMPKYNTGSTEPEPHLYALP